MSYVPLARQTMQCRRQGDVLRCRHRCHRARVSALKGPSQTSPTKEPLAYEASAATRTELIFQKVDSLRFDAVQTGGAGGRTSYDGMLAADAAWTRLRNMQEGAAAGPAPSMVTNNSKPLGQRCQWDVVVCGGTLGVFLAAALAVRGLRVSVVERGKLRGRAQEWNISRKELRELEEVGLFSGAELDSFISSEFNPVRVAFHEGVQIWTRDVLNLGVSPVRLVDGARAVLESNGGQVVEDTQLEGVSVHPDGCTLTLAQADGGQLQVTSQLLVDCMGHASPIVRQARWGNKPDGVCAVVGSMAEGPWPSNTTADVIATNSHLQPETSRVPRHQFFWEAFPSATGPADRTTYMFTYMDAQPWRPSLHALFEEYWELMPQYQGVALDDLTFKRLLFGVFPTFKDSPLQPSFDRVMQAGDASGVQSPLSFGGFGALTRHIRRLTDAIVEAVEVGALSKDDLGMMLAYNPGLSSAWMLQRAMSIPRQEGAVDPMLINLMLSENFKAMESLGPDVMMPFLQDVIQPVPLLKTMGKQMLQEPGLVPKLMMHVGLGPLLGWVGHVSALAAFSAANSSAGALKGLMPNLSPLERYRLRRLLDAIEYGSGADFKP